MEITKDKETKGMSADECRYMETFRLFDANGDGSISVREIGKAMRGLGYNPTDADVNAIIEEVDTDHNGNVDFAEFSTMMRRHDKEQAEMDEILAAFQVFDRDKNGYIDCDELEYALQNVGERMSREEVADMLSYADIDGDGRLNYEEFASMMQQKV